MHSSRALVVWLALGVLFVVVACSSSDLANPAAPAPTTSSEADATAEVEAATQPEPEPETQPEPTAGENASDEAYVSIRQVDFMNGFAYDTGVEYSPVATVTNGEYDVGDRGDDYFWFRANQVLFADLDGDGPEEAIVSTTWNGGGTGLFDSVLVYRLVDGVVIDAGRVLFGDRGDGGIQSVEVDDGIVMVWSFSTTQGACCPNEITPSSLVLGEHEVVVGERGQTRAWWTPNGGATELEFVPGTRSAVITLDAADIEGSFVFEAGVGQRVTLRFHRGQVPDAISITDLSTGLLVPSLYEQELASNGLYEFAFSDDQPRDLSARFELLIDGDLEPAVTWTPQVQQVVVTTEPLVATSLVWPEFASSQPGTDAANQALTEYVTGLDDHWLEDVAEFSEPQGESGYEVSYAVTFVTDDLVSVRFDFYDYVCCRPYPNYGSRAAVVDLVAGRLVEIDEILDPERMNEIVDIWIGELENQGVLPEGVADLLGAHPDFDALNLVPGGVEFSTDRSSLGGGMPGTSTVVSFEQLGDLINPTLVERVTAG